MNIKPPSILTLPTSAPGVPKPCTWLLPGLLLVMLLKGKNISPVSDDTSSTVSSVTAESITQRNETKEGEVYTEKEQKTT